MSPTAAPDQLLVPGKPFTCPHCVHYLIHPFQSRCLLWNRPVEPMADCPKFEKTNGT